MEAEPLSPLPQQERESLSRHHGVLQPPNEPQYAPLIDTLRLYAGWLLAWYVVIYAVGAYQASRDLPFRVPYVEAMLPPYSSLVLTFAVGAFLFLFVSSLHRILGKGIILGTVLWLLGITGFVVYRMNV